MQSDRLARDFWQRKCGYHIQMFEYGRYTEEEFILNMKRMGWDRRTIKRLLKAEAEGQRKPQSREAVAAAKIFRITKENI